MPKPDHNLTNCQEGSGFGEMRLCQVYKEFILVYNKYARWLLKSAEAPTTNGQGLAIVKTKENRILLIDKHSNICISMYYNYARWKSTATR